jgi:DNA-binding NtrC family response regulator
MTGNCNKHRVFVVDDDAQIAEICTLVLREAGFEVETFHDGMAALQRAMEYEPDVVLTDFSMPKMDGITLATCLEKHYPACRVVIISGQAVQLGEDATRNPRFTLLQKPLTPSQILACVQQAVAS